jgi:Tol biopolymer transport system component
MSRHYRIFSLMTILLLALVACARDEQPSLQTAGMLPKATLDAAIPLSTISPTDAPLAPSPIPTQTNQDVFAISVTLEPSPTPGAALRQLTSDGCCTQPFWSPDSHQILFIDRPAPDKSAGLWGIDLDGGAAHLVSDRLGIYSSSFKYRAFPERGQTVIERLADGQRWIIPNGGRSVSFSPDETLLAWSGGASGPPFDASLRTLWISQVDGSQARQVYTAVGGGFSGWLPDGRLLISGVLDEPETGQVLWALSLPANPADPPVLNELARGQRLRSNSVSPGGTWLAYVVTFSDDPTQDGLWLVNTHNGERRQLSQFGAFRWRDDNRLLLIPLDLSQPVHQLWQIDAASGQSTPLTDPALLPFKVANGDWSLSPDGQSIVFLSAQDNNLWLIRLPPD